METDLKFNEYIKNLRHRLNKNYMLLQEDKDM